MVHQGGIFVHIILGVDGGGSKTYAVVVDEQGNKLGSGVSGGGNHQGPGVEAALANIYQAALDSLSEAGLSTRDVTFVQYGLAGADREYDFNILRPALATLPFEAWDVVCDTLEGLRIGSAHNVGVVLVCGSGTNAMGRNRAGQTVQTGGFGYLFGDTAGGHHLAVETFRAAVRSFEYREKPSLLQGMVAGFLGFESMEQVVNYYLDHELGEVPADLTLVLHKAAAEGDEVSIGILEHTGRELGLAAKSVVRRIGGFDGDAFPVVLVGSVLQKGRSPHLLGALEETVRAEYPEACFVIPEMAPVYGSILLGMVRLGLPITDELMKKFASYGGYVL